MSLFTLSRKEFDSLRSGPGGEKITPGDYELALGTLRHIEPSDAWKGKGCYAVTFTVTDNNEQHAGATIEQQFTYHPDPANSGNAAGFAKMNEITVQNMVRLIDALQVDPGGENFDVVDTLTQACEMGGTVFATVSHNAKGYQEIGKFRTAPVA